MRLFRMIQDYKKGNPTADLELREIEKMMQLDKEVQRIQKLYESIVKKNKISKEEQEKIQFGSYRYSTSL